MLTAIENWWIRRCGGREVLTMALPLVISTASFSLMMFVDRMFLLWHTEEEMSAALPAGMLHWTMLCIPFGIAQYVTTFVAQYVGARRLGSVGQVVWHGIYVAIFFAPLFALMWPATPWLFSWFGHPPAITQHEIPYFRLLLLGAPGGVAATALSAFFIGRGETRVVMSVNLCQTAVNIVLDYILVMGIGPFPELGISGAAIATVFSVWMKAGIYFHLMHKGTNRTTYRLDQRQFDLPLLRRMIRFGGPNGIHMLVEASAMTLAVLFLGNLGTHALAATTLAFNVNAVAFFPMIGISMAVTTLVGQEITRNQPDLAARATWTAFVLGAVYSLLFAGLYFGAPDLLLLGHKAGASPEEYASLRNTTVILLRFVAAYCIFDTLQIIFVGALKGAGDTLFVLLNTLVLSTLLVIAGWAGVRYFEGGLYWWWTCFTGWICLLGITYVLRFLTGRWRTMRVIEDSEPDLAHDAEETTASAARAVENQP